MERILIVYQSSWLKRYYPAAFLCALLNNQPMGFWPPSILVRDAQRHGVGVLPLYIHTSEEHCSLDGDRVRVGLNYVVGLGDAAARRILNARYVRPFADLAAFCQRTRLPHSLVAHLIDAGCTWRISNRPLAHCPRPTWLQEQLAVG